MRRIIRKRKLTPKEAAEYRKIRDLLAEELSELIAKHHARMALKDGERGRGKAE